MVVHAYYPLGEPRVEREARAARDAGYDVEVIALRHGDEPQDEVVDGIRVRRVNLRHVRGAGLGRIAVEYVAFLFLAARELLRRRVGRGSIVQVHTPPDFLALAALPARLRGATVLVDIHDLSPHMFGARFGSGAAAWLVMKALSVVELAACALASRVITVHEPYRRELIAHGVPPEKVVVVMNAADEAVIERVRAGNGSKPYGGAFTLGYHGTITWWYGVDLVVEAVKELDADLPGVRAVVLGDGDALETARTRAGELGVSDRVEFSGAYLPLEQALARVASADCGVIPNRASTLNRFALSSKLFEYVALGIPVVVSRLETLASHFGPEEVTFFDPGDSGSLSEAVRWVATHPEEARAKAERARERAAEYAWARNRERYLDVLASA
jgi:glycosyltransferase involved in cell wall biosynthesis